MTKFKEVTCILRDGSTAIVSVNVSFVDALTFMNGSLLGKSSPSLEATVDGKKAYIVASNIIRFTIEK